MTELDKIDACELIRIDHELELHNVRSEGDHDRRTGWS